MSDTTLVDFVTQRQIPNVVNVGVKNGIIFISVIVMDSIFNVQHLCAFKIRENNFIWFPYLFFYLFSANTFLFK